MGKTRKSGRTVVCLLAGPLFPLSWILHLGMHRPQWKAWILDVSLMSLEQCECEKLQGGEGRGMVQTATT